MTPEQTRRVEELLHQAVALPTERRAAFLDQACAADPVARREVDQLLLHHDARTDTARPGDATPTTYGALREAVAVLDDMSGEQVGRYKLLRRIDEGGMGVVYEAEQEQPRRVIALKLIKPGHFSDAARRRFEFEAEVLGRLQHPAVAQIIEAGTFDAGAGVQPFFAMEFIRSKRLTECAGEKELNTRQRLELIAKVCEGVHHAHQKGIIHRDLKPGNILVDSHGQPKILDFGVARATDSDVQTRTRHTHTGQLIGTLAYMSPEQTAGDPNDIDARSDVYALGVVAYELLAGRLPYDLQGKAIADAVRVIREDDPAPLSSIPGCGTGVPPVDRDVEHMVAKALAKEKERRYQSANEFAADIRRYLNDEPIAARPASARYKLQKFTKRNKALVTAALAVAAAFAAGTPLAVVGFVRASASAAEAHRQTGIAQAAEKEQNRAREEAVEARDQNQIVVDFQSSMLGEVDAELMGIRLKKDLGKRLRESLEKKGLDSEQVQSALESFEESLRSINATNAALRILDENVLSRAVETIQRDFHDQPLVRAALQQTVANTYKNIGLYEPALPLQEATLKTRRTELGDDHADTLTSINNMGTLLQAMGKLEEAEPYSREALDGRRRVLGDDHPVTLTSIGDMGALLNSMGEYAEAEPYFREALQGSRRVLGDDHPHTLISIGNMGALLKSMGRHTEAEPYYREALKGSRRVLGDDHPHTLNSINNMGGVLDSMGKLAEAEPYYREALAGYRRVLGNDHPSTLNSINNMGLLRQAQGKLAEAEPYYREALAGYRRGLGDDHPATLNSINSMGFLLQAQGKLEEAMPYFREALAGYRRALGNDHPSTLNSIGNLGLLLHALGKLGDAEPYHREALAGRRAVLGDDHPDTLTSINNMGGLLEAMGKFDEAEPYYRGALEGRRRVLGDDHPRTLTSIGNMGSLLHSMGKLTEAEPHFREALEAKRRVLGDDHPNTLGSINNMGVLLRDLDRLEQAEALGAEAVERGRAALPAGHWHVGVFLGHHAHTLAKMERFGESEERALEAHATLEAALGASHERTTKVTRQLVDLYDAWHVAEPCKGYDAKAAAWRAKLESTTSLPASQPDSGSAGDSP